MMSEPICAAGIQPELLSAWRSRLLAHDDMTRLNTHIPDCPACRAVLERFDRTAEAVRTPPHMPSSQEIWCTMQQRMNQQSPRTPRQQQLLFAGGIGAAALVIFVAVLAFTLAGKGSPNTTGPGPTAILSTATSTTNTTPAATSTAAATGTPGAAQTATAHPTPTAVPPRPYIYFNTNTGKILALNPNAPMDQQVVWHQDNNHGGGYSQPIIVGGTVYAAFFATTPVHQGSIFAFNGQTGATVWHTLVNGNYTVFAQENGVLFAQSINKIIAVRMSDGHILWTYSFANTLGNLAFAEHDGIVAYFDLGPTDHTPQVVAVDATTGGQKWSVLLNPQTFGVGLAAGNGAVFTYELGGHIRALAGSDGHQLWSVMPSASQQSGTLSYDNGIVYAAIFDHAIVAYDAVSGAKKWSVATGPYAPGLPTVANGVAYVPGYDMTIYAINVATGALLWKVDDNVRYEGQLVVSDGWVYAYISSGFIQAYDANTGKITWSDNEGYGFLGMEP